MMDGPFFKLAVPWQQLFDPDVVGDGPQAVAFTDDGVPMRFAHVQYGTRRPDIGYTVRIGGVSVDVAALWAAKGTAAYVSGNGGFPDLIEDITQAIVAPVSASIALQINRNGTTVAVPSSSPAINGQWTTVPSATVGDGYEVEVTVASSNGKGTLTGSPLGVYTPLGSAFGLTLSVAKVSGQGVEEALRTLQFRYRRIGSANVLLTRNINVRALAQVNNEG